MKIIKNEFSDELRNNETDDFYLSQFVWVLYENLSNPFSLKKQIVKYGPPGAALLNKSRTFAELKDQITHLPDNADRSVAKQKFKITNWSTYNKLSSTVAPSLSGWMMGRFRPGMESATPSSRGRPQRYSDLAITTVLN